MGTNLFLWWPTELAVLAVIQWQKFQARRWLPVSIRLDLQRPSQRLPLRRSRVLTSLVCLRATRFISHPGFAGWSPGSTTRCICNGHQTIAVKPAAQSAFPFWQVFEAVEIIPVFCEHDRAVMSSLHDVMRAVCRHNARLPWHRLPPAWPSSQKLDFSPTGFNQTFPEINLSPFFVLTLIV